MAECFRGASIPAATWSEKPHSLMAATLGARHDGLGWSDICVDSS